MKTVKIMRRVNCYLWFRHAAFYSIRQIFKLTNTLMFASN